MKNCYQLLIHHISLSKNELEWFTSNRLKIYNEKNKLIHQATVVGYLIHLSDQPILEDKLNDFLYIFSFEAELLITQIRTGMKFFESVFQNGDRWIIKVMKVCLWHVKQIKPKLPIWIIYVFKARQKCCQTRLKRLSVQRTISSMKK